MSSLRVAVAQAPAVSCDIAANVQTALRLLESANAEGAKLVVFPELFLCGYNLTAISESRKRCTVEVDSEVLAVLGRCCKTLNLTAIIGACVRHARGVANAALVFDSLGQISNVYEKVNLWAGEREIFVPGKKLSMIEVDSFRVGMAICYDAGFPEHMRALALAQADLIVCPSAFRLGEEQRRYRMYFPMRALENTVYVAVANLTGSQESFPFFGESAIFDPAGRMLAVADTSETVVVADLQHSLLKSIRSELCYLNHLRTDFYRRAIAF